MLNKSFHAFPSTFSVPVRKQWNNTQQHQQAIVCLVENFAVGFGYKPQCFKISCNRCTLLLRQWNKIGFYNLRHLFSVRADSFQSKDGVCWKLLPNPFGYGTTTPLYKETTVPSKPVSNPIAIFLENFDFVSPINHCVINKVRESVHCVYVNKMK